MIRERLRKNFATYPLLERQEMFGPARSAARIAVHAKYKRQNQERTTQRRRTARWIGVSGETRGPINV